MVHIEKLYFTLKEIAKRWDVRKCDLAYMAENGDLRVSVRVYTVRLEEGIYELDTRDGQPHRIPFDQSWFSGLQDLTACDAHKAFRYGEARVVQFHAPGDAYVDIIEPSDAIVVQLRQLLVRREERDRVESLHAIAGHTIAEGIGFQHSPDYRTVRLGSVEMNLGIVQAKVIRLLHQASLSDSPWCDGKRVLNEAGATSMRMSDVLKSQKQWRQLIQSDGRGRYRLRLKPE